MKFEKGPGLFLFKELAAKSTTAGKGRLVYCTRIQYGLGLAIGSNIQYFANVYC